MLSTTKKSELLTFQELSILKSLTLNLSCKEIQDLLKINKDSYETNYATLFKKLGASNSYFAVKNAFEMKLLNKKECSAEELKSFSLEYAYSKINQLKNIPSDSKYLLWELYDLLLDFHNCYEDKFNRHDIKV